MLRAIDGRHVNSANGDRCMGTTPSNGFELGYFRSLNVLHVSFFGRMRGVEHSLFLLISA